MEHCKRLYAIGDIHGCYPSLVELMEKLDDDVPLIFLGDIVNRGPESLATIRFIKSLGDRARVILGNHDLHLLASAAGCKKFGRRDTIAEVIAAPDFGEIVEWLRHQYLMIQWNDFLFVHGGINPVWTQKKAFKLAKEVEKKLQSDKWDKYLKQMYGGDQWDDNLKGSARVRAVLNGLTRIRLVDEEGIPDFSHKEGLATAPEGFMPWFEHANRQKDEKTVIFGHWSMLGLKMTGQHWCIDTGCLWGGALTAAEFPSLELISVKAPLYRDPLA